MPLKQIVQPAINPQDIVYHVDNVSDESYEINEKNEGFIFPALKFRNTVIHHTKILSCNLSIGKSFLPQINLSFRDATNSLVDTDYPIQDDLITVLIGNTADTISKPIHADFRLTSVTQSKSTKTITCSGHLHIPNWKSSAIRTFGEKSNFAALQDICAELNIGMITNIQQSEDVDYRNQYGITNAMMVEKMCNDIWLDKDTRCWSFIDAHYNLHVIDLMQMLNEKDAYEQINYDLRTGSKLENKENIVLTNDWVGAENSQFRLANWKPINNVGSTKHNSPTAIKHITTQKNYDTLKIETIEHDNFIQDTSTSTEIDIISSFEDSAIFMPNVTVNAFDNKQAFRTWANSHNALGQRQVLNSMNIDLQLVNTNNVLYMCQKIPVEIFNNKSGTDVLQKDSDTDNEASIEAASNRGERVKNEMFSGWYSIIGFNISYNVNNKMSMSVLCTKRMWSTQYFEQNK